MHLPLRVGAGNETQLIMYQGSPRGRLHERDLEPSFHQPRAEDDRLTKGIIVVGIMHVLAKHHVSFLAIPMRAICHEVWILASTFTAHARGTPIATQVPSAEYAGAFRK